MAQKECNEDIASAQVLGISYQDLGTRHRQDLGLPGADRAQACASCRPTPFPSQTPMDKLRIITSFSNELCEIVANTPARTG